MALATSLVVPVVDFVIHTRYMRGAPPKASQLVSQIDSGNRVPDKRGVLSAVDLHHRW